MVKRNFGKVGVLYGGSSAERAVSLKSGSMVLAALQRQGVDAHGFDTGQHSLAELAQAGFDRVFIALHGRFGEDGTMQGALELLRIPYTGSAVMASSVAMDKVFTKRVWLEEGLPSPRYHVIRAASNASDTGAQLVQQCAQAAEQLGLPLFVKPPHEGSTIGVTKVTSVDQLPAAVQLATQYDDCALVEQYIAGRELTIAVLGTGAAAQALPIIEIIAPGGNYDYEHKYLTNDTRYVCPAAFSAELTTQIQALAVAAYRSIGCSGWGRVDVMLRESDQQPYLLEVNTSPGMTDHSLVPMAAKAAGIEYDELVLRILADAQLHVGRNEVAQAVQSNAVGKV